MLPAEAASLHQASSYVQGSHSAYKIQQVEGCCLHHTAPLSLPSAWSASLSCIPYKEGCHYCDTASLSKTPGEESAGTSCSYTNPGCCAWLVGTEALHSFAPVCHYHTGHHAGVPSSQAVHSVEESRSDCATSLSCSIYHEGVCPVVPEATQCMCCVAGCSKRVEGEEENSSPS